MLSEQPLTVLMMAKVIAHWMVSGLPLLALMPVVGLVMFVREEVVISMVLAMLLVSPTLSLLGAIGAALTAGVQRGGLLVTLLILPLYIPVLILGTGFVQAVLLGGEYLGFIYWLGAILLLSLSLAPFAIVAAIRVAVER